MFEVFGVGHDRVDVGHELGEVCHWSVNRKGTEVGHEPTGVARKERVYTFLAIPLVE